MKALNEEYQKLLLAAAEKYCNIEEPQATTRNANNVVNNATSSVIACGIRIYIADETEKIPFGIKHIKAILVHVFNHTPASILKKPELIRELKRQVENAPGLIPAAAAPPVSTNVSDPSTAAAAATADSPPLPPHTAALPGSTNMAASSTPCCCYF